MQIGKRKVADQFERLAKIFIRLAWKSDDHIGADGGIRQHPAYHAHALGVMRGAIPAMHGLQNAVGARLQRHVKMRRQASGRSHRGTKSSVTSCGSMELNRSLWIGVSSRIRGQGRPTQHAE